MNWNKLWILKRMCCMRKSRLSFLSPHSPKLGHISAPIWLSCHDNWVCGLKSDMISKLIKHRKKKRTWSVYQKTYCLSYTAFKCLKLLITGMLGNVVFLGHTASIKKGLKKKKTIRKIKYLKELEEKFLFEHKPYNS